MNPHPSHKFKPGGAPGPGRPKGSVGGRAATIQMIDDLLTENADDLRAALEAEFKKNPVAFWTKYGFPLVPQALVARVETTGASISWTSLLDTLKKPAELAPASTSPLSNCEP